jgi:hypothetical protein
MSVSVRPYRNGGWEVDIRWRDASGDLCRERRRVTVASQSAAQRAGEVRERELLIRGPQQSKKEVPTLEQFAPRFIEGHAKANRHQPEGIAQKEQVLRIHLLPQLGEKRLDAITNEDVQRLKSH